MASFQSKIGRKSPRETENKNYRSVSFLPDTKQKIQTPLWIHFKKKKVEKGCERVKIRIIFPFRSYPTQKTNFEKNSKKIQKIKKYHYGFISIQNRSEEAKKNQK